MRWIAFSLILLLGLGLCAAARAQESEEAIDVEDWADILETPGISETDRHQALVALRAQAAGLLDNPETKKATLALAVYWSDHLEDANRSDAIRAMSAAATLYPDDSMAPGILEALAKASLVAGDRLSAHVSLSRLVDSKLPERNPELAAQAADAAAEFGDFAATLEWIRRIDPSRLSGEGRLALARASLKAYQATDRLDLALEAAERLEATDPVALHTDPRALLAAARSRESAGLLEAAAENYVTYVNIYPTAIDRPDALLRIGRLFARTGELVRAGRFLEWLIDEHGGSMEATHARLELLELEDAPVAVWQIESYLTLIRDADDVVRGRQSAERFAERMIVAGLPLELLIALSRLARERPDSVPAMIAEETAEQNLEPILALLALRNDQLSLAAALVQARDLGLTIPPSQWKRARAAARTYGLSLAAPELETVIEEARTLIEARSWLEAVDRLERALRGKRLIEPLSEGRARRLLATAMWRAGDSAGGLGVIEQALTQLAPECGIRAFHVLRADILLSTGSKEEACASYARAASLGQTPWVAAQTERCATMVSTDRPRSDS